MKMEEGVDLTSILPGQCRLVSALDLMLISMVVKSIHRYVSF